MIKVWIYLLLAVTWLSRVRSIHPPKIILSHGGALLGTSLRTVNGRPVEAFLGIPYAEPPVGPLRFRSPLPASSWTGIRRAQASPTACLQSDIFSIDKVPFGEEDCLYLNVYIPGEKTVSNLPVLVWIHGGGFHMGSSDPIFFGPERFLDNNIVLVTINYRLGALGFLSTGTEDSPGNYGLKDQALALKWVRDNIQEFGGNSHDITLFGHSAGAASISYHMISPQSKGLFHKAILQSGNYFDPWAFIPQHTAIERLRQLGTQVGCPLRNQNFAKLMICLRKLPAADIVSTIANFYIDDTYFPITVFGPVIEPNNTEAFLAENPRDIIESHGTSIPIIIGVTTDEGISRSGPILHQFDQHFRANFHSILPQLLDYDHKPPHIQTRITEKIDNFYFKGAHNWSKGNHQKLTDMFSDRLFYYGLDQYLRNRFTSTNRPVGKTHIYVFGHRGPKSTSEIIGSGSDYYGVSHGDELPFLFPNGQLNVPGTRPDQLMRWALPKMWSDFAWSGDPTPQGTTIREEWKSAHHYPLRYAQIGSIAPTTNYKQTKFGTPRALNYTSPFQITYTKSSDLANYLQAYYDRYSYLAHHPSTYAMPSQTTLSPQNKILKATVQPDNYPVEKRHKINQHNNKTKHQHKKRHRRATFFVLKNKKELITRRMNFWRSLERLLYN